MSDLVSHLLRYPFTTNPKPYKEYPQNFTENFSEFVDATYISPVVKEYKFPNRLLSGSRSYVPFLYLHLVRPFFEWTRVLRSLGPLLYFLFVLGVWSDSWCHLCQTLGSQENTVVGTKTQTKRQERSSFPLTQVEATKGLVRQCLSLPFEFVCV